MGISYVLCMYVSHYLLHDGNLYCFSQQGKVIMLQITYIYHRFTLHGGHGLHIWSHIFQNVIFLCAVYSEIVGTEKLILMQIIQIQQRKTTMICLSTKATVVIGNNINF